MKKLLITDYIYTPSQVLENKAVLIDKKIIKILSKDEALKKYDNKDVQIIDCGKNTLLFPGLINSHVHLEFSANKTTLSYGDFIKWLYSVIKNRDELVSSCNESCMQKALDEMLENGITTIGAISSHGSDLSVCANAKQNVVFFNELIGSQAAMADVLFGDFLQRLDDSKNIKREGFFPAIAIHSPYSVHPILIKKALDIAKNENLRVSAHFMESKAEREWLDKNDGGFKEFFENLLKQNKAVSTSEEFLENFDGIKTLFAHVIKANDKEYDKIKSNSHSIAHCPISNRLLGNGAIDLKKVCDKGINVTIATDGLSSNYKLDLWEEMKVALFMHSEYPLLELAKKLLDFATINPAKALNLNKGIIQEEKDADLLVLDIEDEINEELPIHLILHKYKIIKKFINGEEI